MASRIRPKRGRGRQGKSAIDLEEIREAEIRRREYKTPQQIEEESKRYVYGNDVYKVSRILAKRLCNGKKEYLIKWHGYPKSEATWEPADNILDPSVIKKFESKDIVHINVSHEDVQKASDDDDGEPTRKRRRKMSSRRSRQLASEKRWKRIENSEESDDNYREEQQEGESSFLSSAEVEEDGRSTKEAMTLERTTPTESISRDGDSSGEEIAEEPLSEKEMDQLVEEGSFVEATGESVDKGCDSSRSSSSNFSEIQDIVNMMTERVAMEIEGVQLDINACLSDPHIDWNNNDTSDCEPDVSHSIKVLPSNPRDDDNDSLVDTGRNQGSILGSAVRSGIRVYLVRWSTGTRQVLTHSDVKEKWPQLLIKFYESNIHWLKKLK